MSQTNPSFSPLGIAVDGAGKIHVVLMQYGVVTFNANGIPTTPTITARLHNPQDVAVDAVGKIFVSDSGTRNFLTSADTKVTIFNPDGTQTTVPIITAGLDSPQGVAVDTAGKVYVANSGLAADLGTVTTYNPDGTRATPTITAGLNHPIGIAVH